MSDHKLVWKYDNGYVHAEVVCMAPEGSCRASCADPDSYCESYYGFEFRDGSWWHKTAEDEWHPCRVSDCNVEVMINESGYVEELNAAPDEFIIGEFPIEAIWNGSGSDEVEWRRVS